MIGRQGKYEHDSEDDELMALEEAAAVERSLKEGDELPDIEAQVEDGQVVAQVGQVQIVEEEMRSFFQYDIELSADKEGLKGDEEVVYFEQCGVEQD